MAAVGLELCSKAEIIVPVDEFEASAELHQRPKLLREKHLGRHPTIDDEGLSMVIYCEGQALVIGLRDRVRQLGAVARVN